MIKKNREKLQKEAHKRYQFSEEEKDKKHKYAPKQYRNLCEEGKEKKCQYSRE